MLSVMTPVNFRLPGAAARSAIVRRLTRRGFITGPDPRPYGTGYNPGRKSAASGTDNRRRRRLMRRLHHVVLRFGRLFARRHEVGGRRAGIHDPHAATLVIL